MFRKNKFGRNAACPCGSGKKYKHCCKGIVDWEKLTSGGNDWIQYLSIRGKNILFVNRIADALQMDSGPGPKSLKDYKAAFTVDAVVKIHQAIMEIWPPNMDIQNTLKRNVSEISGLYIGDYNTQYIQKGLVRHSTYSQKLLVVDPFVYPTSVRDEYNPILTPEQYRSQTLRNVNFWFSLLPWIEEGIVEIIRTPADFDPELNWESMKNQRKKFEENDELKRAAEQSVREYRERHMEEEAFRKLVLSAPDESLRNTFEELNLEEKGITRDQFISYIQHQRDEDPDFLEPLGADGSGQLHMITTGTSYDIATITANITDSYLVTDVYSKWKEMEIDRKSANAINKEWSPFAKAFQNMELKYLNNLSLEHALKLRQENRLGSLRAFLRKVWNDARSTELFSEANAKLLADELNEEVRKAEEEWKQIDRNLIKWFGAELSTGLLAAGPLIASGHAAFLAAAAASAGLTTLASTRGERTSFQTKYPASFFLDLK